MASGDEDVKQLLSTLLRKELIQKPPNYKRGLNINLHLSKVDKFFNSINVYDKSLKISMLGPTLDDDVYAELCCQSDYSIDKNCEWISNKLNKVFEKKTIKCFSSYQIIRGKPKGWSIFA